MEHSRGLLGGALEGDGGHGEAERRAGGLGRRIAFARGGSPGCRDLWIIIARDRAKP